MIENFLGKERYGIWLCPVYRGEQQHIDTAANLKFMTREGGEGMRRKMQQIICWLHATLIFALIAPFCMPLTLAKNCAIPDLYMQRHC